MFSLLKDLESRSRAVSIAVIGDLMIDRLSDGMPVRHDPDTGAPILPEDTPCEWAGGAANVAVNAAALGALVRTAGLVGDDAEGRSVHNLLGSRAIDTTGLVIDRSRPTTVKHRFAAAGVMRLRVDRESTDPVAAPARQQVNEAALASARAAGVLVLSDYAKGVLAPELARDLVTTAVGRGIPVLVDSKSPQLAPYVGSTCITPNLPELRRLTGCSESDADIAAAATWLRAELGLGAVIATLGTRGAMLADEAGTQHIAAGEGLPALDANGAGDSFLAALAVAIGIGLPMDSATELACRAGAVASLKRGTAAPSVNDLRDLVPESPLSILDQDTARMIGAWRQSGLRIGFTNGCFDLLHAGHVHLLRAAREKCDRLIVAVNTDASVRRLKGPGRPMNRLAERLAVLAALRAVDHVMAFDEDTPLRLIDAIRPDVLVKGSDYRLGQVVGAAEVIARGGDVVLVDMVEGLSTTAVLDRARSSAS